MNYHFDYTKNPEGGWTEQEMKEGFLPGEPSTKAQRELDMSRRMDLAGKTVEQVVSGTRYEVTYDDDGYAVVAKKKEG